MKIISTLTGIFGANAAATNTRSHSIDRSVVRDFRMEEFTGVWYEIARLDNAAERGLSHVSAIFTVDADGEASLRTESLRCGAASFEVTRSQVSVPDPSRRAAMKVSGMPFTDREFNVLEVDEDYNFALVGGRSANRLRILSRAPYIPDDDLGYLIARALERGYDISNLVFPEHAAVVSPRELLACAI